MYGTGCVGRSVLALAAMILSGLVSPATGGTAQQLTRQSGPLLEIGSQRALIREPVRLPAGVRSLYWEPPMASDLIASAGLFLPEGLRVIRRDLMRSPQDRDSMLAAWVGRRLEFREAPGSAWQTGELLQVRPIVVRDESGFLRIDVPVKHLRMQADFVPTHYAFELNRAIDAESDDAELLYATGALHWEPRYEMLLDPDVRTLELRALALIDNSSGASWPDARISLLAGQTSDHRPRPRALAMAVQAEGARVDAQADAGIYRLELPAPVDVEAHSSSLMPLGHWVSDEAEFAWSAELPSAWYHQGVREFGVQVRLQAQAPADLEFLLPPGSAQLQVERDPIRQLRWEGRVSGWSAGESIDLALGADPDVRGARRALQLEREGDLTRVRVRTQVRSHAPDVRELVLREPLPPSRVQEFDARCDRSEGCRIVEQADGIAYYLRIEPGQTREIISDIAFQN